MMAALYVFLAGAGLAVMGLGAMAFLAALLSGSVPFGTRARPSDFVYSGAVFATGLAMFATGVRLA